MKFKGLLKSKLVLYTTFLISILQVLGYMAVGDDKAKADADFNLQLKSIWELIEKEYRNENQTSLDLDTSDSTGE